MAVNFGNNDVIYLRLIPRCHRNADEGWLPDRDHLNLEHQK